MSDIDTLTIGEAREAVQRGKEIEKILGSKECSKPSPSNGSTDNGLQIIILDRGYVYVGNVSIDDNWVLITTARNVRRWGTTKGLGELAANGPLKDSIIDPVGTVRAPLRALIGLIECEASKWTK
jgi:hypothetical protein